ncbi:MAG: glutathione S-transferase [Candidatus Pseudothioglobus sp.]|jgi:glutathione S-transferase
MHLFTMTSSPNGRRVAVVMKEKGIEIPTTEINLRGGENLSAQFKVKNPVARVPVLETGSGVYIAETVAISRYLESLVPEPNLFGVSGEEQALIEMWNRRAEINLLIPVAQAFRNLTGVFKDREKISQEWGEISAEIARDAMPMFETQLAGADYLAGEHFSIADITLALTLTFAKAVGQDLLQTPAVVAWHTKVSARPSFM